MSLRKVGSFFWTLSWDWFKGKPTGNRNPCLGGPNSDFRHPARRIAAHEPCEDVQADVVCYGGLIHACAGYDGAWRVAMQLLAEMLDLWVASTPIETWLCQHQNKGKPPFTSCNVQVYNVSSISIPSRDPNLSRQPSKTQGKPIRCLKRTMVEKNGEASPRSMVAVVFLGLPRVSATLKNQKGCSLGCSCSAAKLRNHCEYHGFPVSKKWVHYPE